MSEKAKESKKEAKKESDKDKDKAMPLDESDITLLKRYGRGPYFEPIKKAEDDLKDFTAKIGKLCGIKESDTGLSAPSEWFLTVTTYPHFIERQKNAAGRTASTGCQMHQDHRQEHARSKVYNQRETNCKICCGPR